MLVGEVVLFVGVVCELFVDVDDIVDVVVVVFIDVCFVSCVIEVIGLCVLMFVEVIDEIVWVVGWLIVYCEILYDVFVVGLSEVGVLELVVVLFDDLFDGVFDGCNSVVMYGVEVMFGCLVCDFVDYVCVVVVIGVWSV